LSLSADSSYRIFLAAYGLRAMELNIFVSVDQI